jgi:copper transport protein
VARLPEVSLHGTDLSLGQATVSATGEGSFRTSAIIPTSGRWEVQVGLRSCRFDNPVVTVSFRLADRG